MESSLPSEALWRSGLRGARANLLPGVILQLAALGLVVGYYNISGVHNALTRLVEIRQAAGLGFGMASTALFGGVLPLLYIRFARRIGDGNPRYGWIQGIGLTAFWAYKGLEIELWYRLQAHVVGSGHEATTIAVKVFLDQFVFSPALAIPDTAAAYQIVDGRFDWNGLFADMRAPGWYRRRVLPVLISNLGVWMPAVAVIFALPTPLQLPLENIVLCFFTLIVAHQTRGSLASIRVQSGTEAVAGLNPTP
jgi:hypothetical protein